MKQNESAMAANYSADPKYFKCVELAGKLRAWGNKKSCLPALKCPDPRNVALPSCCWLCSSRQGTRLGNSYGGYVGRHRVWPWQLHFQAEKSWKGGRTGWNWKARGLVLTMVWCCGISPGMYPHSCTILSLQWPCEAGTFFSILQMGKVKLPKLSSGLEFKLSYF